MPSEKNKAFYRVLFCIIRASMKWLEIKSIFIPLFQRQNFDFFIPFELWMTEENNELIGEQSIYYTIWCVFRYIYHEIELSSNSTECMIWFVSRTNISFALLSAWDSHNNSDKQKMKHTFDGKCVNLFRRDSALERIGLSVKRHSMTNNWFKYSNASNASHIWREVYRRTQKDVNIDGLRTQSDTLWTAGFPTTGNRLIAATKVSSNHQTIQWSDRWLDPSVASKRSSRRENASAWKIRLQSNAVTKPNHRMQSTDSQTLTNVNNNKLFCYLYLSTVGDQRAVTE